jgi:DNA-nicking Smr family endonuclease
MNRRRDLSEEEARLWSGIARSIKPLRSAKRAVKPAAHPAANPAAKPVAKPVTKPVDSGDGVPPPPRAAAKPRLPAPIKSPPLAPFDRRLKQRVARGREAIDARLDLHGLTQSEAHAALLSFLRRAQMDGARIALVVTGKGAREGERGVLRRQTPQWLALPEFRPFVGGFEEAHVSHGGEGALYIHLRRAR